MDQNTSPNIATRERNIYFALFVLVYIYLWLRAIYVPFVHDEIATFYHYIQTGNFLPYLSHWDANNHFLNSGMSWLSYVVWGLDEWSLRLPNLLVVPLMFWAVFQIANQITNLWLRVAWILAIILNHFFIEYLALSRGYGMSMAFLFAAIWFTFQIVKTNKFRFYLLQVVMFVFMLLSNLTLIYSIFILLIVTTLITVIKNHEQLSSFFYRILLLTAGGFAPLALAVQYLFELRSRNLLYYGIEGGFWSVTAETLIQLSVGFSSWFFSIIVATLLIIAVFIFLNRIGKSQRIKQILQPDFIFNYLLFGNIALFVLMHFLLAVKYPEDRVGMFFLPYFLGSLILGVDNISSEKTYRITRYLPILFLMIPVNFLLSINLKYSTYWKEMGIPQRFYEQVNKNLNPNDLPPVVGGHYLLSYFWAMENYRDEGMANLLHHTDSTEITDDYLIANINDNPEWENLYDVIDFDKLRNIHLLKRKKPAHREWLTGTGRFNSPDTINNRYYLLKESNLDSLAGDDLLFEWNMWIESSATPFRAAIVLDIVDKQGQQCYYKTYNLFHQRLTWDKSTGKARNCIKVSDLPAGSHRFKLYLWNKKDAPFTITDGFINIYRLSANE